MTKSSPFKASALSELQRSQVKGQRGFPGSNVRFDEELSGWDAHDDEDFDPLPMLGTMAAKMLGDVTLERAKADERQRPRKKPINKVPGAPRVPDVLAANDASSDDEEHATLQQHRSPTNKVKREKQPAPMNRAAFPFISEFSLYTVPNSLWKSPSEPLLSPQQQALERRELAPVTTKIVELIKDDAQREKFTTYSKTDAFGTHQNTELSTLPSLVGMPDLDGFLRMRQEVDALFKKGKRRTKKWSIDAQLQQQASQPPPLSPQHTICKHDRMAPPPSNTHGRAAYHPPATYWDSTAAEQLEAADTSTMTQDELTAQGLVQVLKQFRTRQSYHEPVHTIHHKRRPAGHPR